MRCLIAYHIACPERAQTVQNALKPYAKPMQTALYLYDGHQALLSDCIDSVLEHLHPTEDHISITPLDPENDCLVAGVPFETEAVL
ncbi:hypothetical protein [Aquaspirillum soli]